MKSLQKGKKVSLRLLDSKLMVIMVLLNESRTSDDALTVQRTEAKKVGDNFLDCHVSVGQATYRTPPFFKRKYYIPSLYIINTRLNKLLLHL